MSLRVGSTVLNVLNMERAIEFWTKALGYVSRDPGAEYGDFAVLCHPDQSWSNVSLQLARRPKREPNRVHLDLYADDQAAEVERLEQIGATRIVPWPYKEDADYVVMADPDGNEFCVVQLG